MFDIHPVLLKKRNELQLYIIDYVWSTVGIVILKGCVSNVAGRGILYERWCLVTYGWYVYLESETLRWRHDGRDGVSDHQPHDCLLNRLFGCRSKKTSKLRVIGLSVGNSPGTGEFPAQMASNAQNVSIRWRHHEIYLSITYSIGVDLHYTAQYIVFCFNILL